MEFGCPDLDQPTMSPQASQGKWWVDAGDQNQVKIGRLVIQQVTETGMDLVFLDDMIIIQNQGEIAGQLGDIIDQVDNYRFAVAQLRRTGELARFYSYLLVNILNRGDQVGPEPDRIIVPLVK